MASTTRPEDAIHVQSWLCQSEQQEPFEKVMITYMRFYYLLIHARR